MASNPQAPNPEGDPRQMPLDSLAEECRAEYDLFLRRQKHDGVYTYEMFRRAFGEGNEEALDHVIQIYKRGFMARIYRHPNFQQTGEDAEYLFYCALGDMCLTFARKRANAEHPEWFTEKFLNVAKIFKYFQVCVANLVANSIDPIPQMPLESYEPVSSFDFTNACFDWEHIWALIETCLQDEKQFLIMRLSLGHGLKPREICQQHAEFQDVKEVHALKEQARRRLRRCRKMADFLGAAN